MPIELGGYGAERVDSIFTTGKFSSVDAISLGLLFVGAMFPLVAIIAFFAGIVLYFTKGAKSKSWRVASLILIVGSIIEGLASVFGSYWATGIAQGKYPTSWAGATTLGSKVQYLLTYPSSKTTTSVLTAGFPGLTQSLMESFGGITSF